MKKKILLAFLTVVAFICIFAASVSAAVYDKTEKVSVSLIDASTVACELYDNEGDELVWYTLDGGATVQSVKTKELYTSSALSTKLIDVKSLGDIYLNADTALQIQSDNTTNLIVVANLRSCTFSTVTHSGYKATFSSSPVLQYVYLPQTITNLGCNIFQYSPLLKVCDIPSDASFILSDSNSFIGCTSLVEINLMGCTKIVGVTHFATCTSLERCYMDPDKLAYNCSLSGMFDGCRSLTQFGNVENTCIVPDGITFIGNNTFKYTKFEVAILPDTIETMGYNIFDSNTALTTVNIPSALKSEGGCLFLGCSSLTNVIGLEDCKLTSIGQFSFKGTALTEITLPNSVTSIGYEAFSGCTNLTKINLGKSASSFGQNVYTQSNAFENSGLTVLYISENVTKFPEKAFNNCSSLTTIFFTGNQAEAQALISSTVEKYNTPFFELSPISYKEYSSLGDKSGKYLIYDYNLCDAFYNGEHEMGEIAYRFEDEAYTTDYCSFSDCTNCKITVKTVIVGALFVNKGYSKAYDGTSFTYGISINKDNIEAYEEKTGNTVSYGFAVGAVPELEAEQIIDKDANALVEKLIIASFDDVLLESFTLYNLKMVGINTEEQQKTPIYCCAFVIDGEEVYYMGETVTKKPISVSSQSINK